MGIVRHPSGEIPDTLSHPCAPSIGESGILRSHDAAHSCCVASQRSRTVTFDNEALIVEEYRSNFPSYMSNRSYWGTTHPPIQIFQFLHPAVHDVSERRARAQADRLAKSVYGKDLRNLPEVIVIHNDEDSFGHSSAPSPSRESDTPSDANSSFLVVGEIIPHFFL